MKDRAGLKGTQDSKSKLKLSLAAAALVVATSAAEPSAQAASGVAVAASAAVSQVSESTLLRKIQAYCSQSWRNAGIRSQEWPDCTQQVFARLLERIPRERLLQAIDDPDSPERRELNRAIWATSQRSRRAKSHSPLVGDAGRVDEADVWPAKMARIEQVQQAVDSKESRLSPTQREIVSRWSDGESISEIAESLKLSPARISDEKYKAIQKLRRYFSSREDLTGIV